MTKKEKKHLLNCGCYEHDKIVPERIRTFAKKHNIQILFIKNKEDLKNNLSFIVDEDKEVADFLITGGSQKDEETGEIFEVSPLEFAWANFMSKEYIEECIHYGEKPYLKYKNVVFVIEDDFKDLPASFMEVTLWHEIGHIYKYTISELVADQFAEAHVGTDVMTTWVRTIWRLIKERCPWALFADEYRHRYAYLPDDDEEDENI